MKDKNGAILYWIDPESLSIESKIIMHYELRNGATYDSEATWKMPDNVQYYEVVHLSETGNPSSVERINRLKSRAKDYKI